MSWLEKILGLEEEKEKTPEENIQQLFETEKKLKKGIYKGKKITWENRSKKILSEEKKTGEPLFIEEKHTSSTEKKYNYLFIGTVIGIIVILLVTWALKESPSQYDCIKACAEQEGYRPESWIQDCMIKCKSK